MVRARLAKVGAGVLLSLGLGIVAPLAAAGPSGATTKPHATRAIPTPCPVFSILQPGGILISAGCTKILFIPYALS